MDEKLWGKPNASGVIDSTSKAGITYKLIYKTGVVELSKTFINQNQNPLTDTLFVGKFFTLSNANGGNIVGAGTLKWIKDDLFFALHAGQQFGGKVKGLFKFNLHTNAITRLIFIDEFYNNDKKKIEKKYKLKTKEIITFHLDDWGKGWLAQNEEAVAYWNGKTAAEKKERPDFKPSAAMLSDIAFLKKFVHKPYYFHQKKPKDESYLHNHHLAKKNIFSDEKKYELDTTLLKNADRHISEVLNEYQKPVSHQVKVLDFINFDKLYFFYVDKPSNEVKIIRYDMDNCTWLLGNFAEVEIKPKNWDSLLQN
ncbi:hypothetical protein [Pedobacter agri]|uniref:hypothetical protein n=1 Tax=Pedobacter agri TaxID=454586 RepID=UPI00292E274C|nr:hypothetical protein [Pedobacter agri]